MESELENLGIIKVMHLEIDDLYLDSLFHLVVFKNKAYSLQEVSTIQGLEKENRKLRNELDRAELNPPILTLYFKAICLFYCIIISHAFYLYPTSGF